MLKKYRVFDRGVRIVRQFRFSGKTVLHAVWIRRRPNERRILEPAPQSSPYPQSPGPQSSLLDTRSASLAVDRLRADGVSLPNEIV